MIKFFIVFFIALLVYAAMIIWITQGVKLEPIDKFLICSFTIIPLGAALLISLSFDWIGRYKE